MQEDGAGGAIDGYVRAGMAQMELVRRRHQLIDVDETQTAHVERNEIVLGNGVHQRGGIEGNGIVVDVDQLNKNAH